MTKKATAKEKSVKDLKDEEINLLEYVYPQGTMVQIPGRLLEGLIQILNEVDKKESTRGFIDKYPTTSKKMFNETNKEHLQAVQTNWEVYPTAESYFNQEPQEIKSMLGVMALDLLLLLKQGHLENIRSGVAVKLGTFETEIKNEEVKLS